MKKTIVIGVAVFVALIGIGSYLYSTNSAPKVAEISAAEVASAAKPIVVKLHAQWCPICMMTKDTWSRIEKEYGSRALLVVLDFTNEETTRASAELARRLGLQEFFDESAGTTGVIAVLDARSRKVLGWVSGKQPFTEYSAAIDAALTIAR